MCLLCILLVAYPLIVCLTVLGDDSMVMDRNPSSHSKDSDSKQHQVRILCSDVYRHSLIQ